MFIIIKLMFLHKFLIVNSEDANPPVWRPNMSARDLIDHFEKFLKPYLD